MFAFPTIVTVLPQLLLVPFFIVYKYVKQIIIILYFFRRAFLNRAKKAHSIENTTIVMLILLRFLVPLKIESGKLQIAPNSGTL